MNYCSNTINTYINRAQNNMLTKDYYYIYSDRFLNFSSYQTRYNPIPEDGEMLVICYDSFCGDMEPFVNWKNQKGIKTTLVPKSTAGSTLSSIKKIIGEYSNFDFGIKVTRNLAITGKLFGFSTAKESPQILGAGIQYYYGGIDTLNWVSSIQRVDLKGLSHFRLTSLTFDIRKWIEWKSIQFRIGIGSNFFKERSYKGYSEPSSMKGQINFVGADALKSYSFFKYGIGTRIHPGRTLVTFFIQKELF